MDIAAQRHNRELEASQFLYLRLVDAPPRLQARGVSLDRCQALIIRSNSRVCVLSMIGDLTSALDLLR
jgi:hypothetical protein